ncbi:hypothetical protein PENCOP_c020G03236 [Penicillium coprophilum]|uniref:HTH CENPB-type domain-containing protein n=1 Tax=Penicillium coprophilum TaxID=36646 RepID=A0A1V6U7B7_9EURO|nr:hypothetical protein PENCOP_c020G03236 [Penicillium coprophilum]
MDSLYGSTWSSPPALYVISVGENWVTNFVKRRPLLSSRFSKRYNYERAKYEDPKIIREWFNLV